MSRKRSAIGFDDDLGDFQPAKDVRRPSPAERAKETRLGEAHGFTSREGPQRPGKKKRKRVTYDASITIKVLPEHTDWFRATSNERGLVAGKLFEQMIAAWREKHEK